MLDQRRRDIDLNSQTQDCNEGNCCLDHGLISRFRGSPAIVNLLIPPQRHSTAIDRDNALSATAFMEWRTAMLQCMKLKRMIAEDFGCRRGSAVNSAVSMVEPPLWVLAICWLSPPVA